MPPAPAGNIGCYNLNSAMRTGFFAVTIEIEPRKWNQGDAI